MSADVIDLGKRKEEIELERRRDEYCALTSDHAVQELLHVFTELEKLKKVGNAFASTAEQIVRVKNLAGSDKAKFDAVILKVLLKRAEQLRLARIAEQERLDQFEIALAQARRRTRKSKADLATPEPKRVAQMTEEERNDAMWKAVIGLE